MRLPFDNSYARLPERFYARIQPTPVRSPTLIKVNEGLAKLLGLDAPALASPEGVEVLSGRKLPEGAEPIAMAYAGHQFGGFVPQLGDGRAILLGEIVGVDGKRRDLQLKGAGRTPFSRGGDGRSALGPVLREYIVSEAMAALGIPATRALAAVTTGEMVLREQPLPGAILARVASSHIRVGTFEYFAARRDDEALAILTRYALERHFPQAADEGADEDDEALRLLNHVMRVQARLVASWLGVGFIHGVMNTDNTSIAGETIDFGPCAFLDEYNPGKVFSSIDHGGRYAFGRQPRIAHWNLIRLAECLLPLIDEDAEKAAAKATAALQTFPDLFDEAHDEILRRKLGLADKDSGDRALFADLLERMASNDVDFTLLFRHLSASAEDASADSETAALFDNPGAFFDWAPRWRERLAKEERSPEERSRAMRRANPAFIPRNHRIEEAITSAVASADLGPFEELVRVLAKPYDDQADAAYLQAPPEPKERVTRTFCGT